MRYGFRHKNYHGFVIWPPDDFTYDSAVKLVRKDINKLLKQKGSQMPKVVKGCEGLVRWKYRYVEKTF